LFTMFRVCLHQIRHSSQEIRNVVGEMTYPTITSLAEKASDQSSDVIVIHRESVPTRAPFSADRARAVLRGEHGIVFHGR
jgi:hypothetical protein